MNTYSLCKPNNFVSAVFSTVFCYLLVDVSKVRKSIATCVVSLECSFGPSNLQSHTLLSLISERTFLSLFKNQVVRTTIYISRRKQLLFEKICRRTWLNLHTLICELLIRSVLVCIVYALSYTNCFFLRTLSKHLLLWGCLQKLSGLMTLRKKTSGVEIIRLQFEMPRDSGQNVLLGLHIFTR